jgi:hypothetical protein
VKEHAAKQEITKLINATNEDNAASSADAAGGRLQVVRAYFTHTLLPCQRSYSW